MFKLLQLHKQRIPFDLFYMKVCEKGICSGQKTLFTVDELCQKVLENPEAKAEFNVPNGYCSQRLKCKYDTPDGPTTKGTRITPSEGTPCGEGGVSSVYI